MPGRLDGLVAVVNGAGRGIGRAVALDFARQGARVVVNDLGTSSDDTLDSGRAQRVAADIVGSGGKAIADNGDISDPDDAARLVDKAIDHFGQLDILVNAAGIVRLGTIVDTPAEDFDNIMRVHVRGYYNTSQLAARHWVERKQYGRLINFVSMAAIVSYPGLFAYSTAKSAIVGMTRSCANALVSYNVTANCIRPNAASGMTDALSPAAREHFERTGQLLSESSTGTIADPAHITPMVTYLASPAAAHVTGRLVEARGGHYALWYEPAAERTYDGDFLADPDGVYDGIHRMFEGLSPKDLPMPLPPFDQLGDWKQEYGTNTPRWDFAGLGSV